MDEMIVYVVYDPLYEEVISVHKTETTANARAGEKDKKDRMGEKRESYYHEVEGFVIEG